MKYLLIKDGIIQNVIELDPENINNGTPCPRELLHIIPQPDLVTPQPDLVEEQPDIIEKQPDLVEKQVSLVEAQPDIIEPQPPIQKLDDDGKPVFDEDNKPVMIPQPDKVTPQAPKIIPQPDKVTPQPDIITKQHDIITPQPALIEPQPDIELDGRYKVPEGCELIASELGSPGDAYPLVAPVIDPNETILEQIRVLEAGVSDRRLREAILGTDNGWLAGINKQVADLRGQLK